MYIWVRCEDKMFILPRHSQSVVCLVLYQVELDLLLDLLIPGRLYISVCSRGFTPAMVPRFTGTIHCQWVFTTNVDLYNFWWFNPESANIIYIITFILLFNFVSKLNPFYVNYIAA